MIVVGGPIVNSVARTLLGVESYTYDADAKAVGDAVAMYFADEIVTILFFNFVRIVFLAHSGEFIGFSNRVIY